jgi:hypothetical protein
MMWATAVLLFAAFAIGSCLRCWPVCCWDEQVMPASVYCLLSAVCCLLSAVCCLLSAVYYVRSAGCCLPPALYCPLSVICLLLDRVLL